MHPFWIKIGSFMMFLAVTLGAFGAHALKERLAGYDLEIYKTAVLYHCIHALALFIVAWVQTQFHEPKADAAGLFFLLGIILFSGSLYALSLTHMKWLGALTPLGGLSFLIGWMLLFMSKYA